MLLLSIRLLAPHALAHEIEGGFDAHGFHLAQLDGDPRDPLQIQRPGYMTGGDLYGSVLFEYASSPLVYVSSDGEAEAVLDDLLLLNAGLGVAIARWLRIDVAAPLYFSSTGESGAAEGFALGDMRVGALLAPLRPDGHDGGFGLGLAPWVGVPTGPQERFLGEPGVDGGVDLVGTIEAGALTLTADLGGHFRPAVDLENLRGDDTLRAALAAGVTPAEGLGFTLEWNVEAPMAANVEPGTATPSEVLLSGRKRFSNGLHFGAGAAAGVMRGASAADYRAFLGLGYGRIAAPPPKDRDGDGITDDVDACLDDKETVNAWKDSDGCPDALGTMEVEVVHKGLPVANAPVTLTGPSGAENFVTTETLWSRDVMPETDWKAEATAPPCLAGSASGRAAEGATRIVVSLQPVLDARVRVEVVGPDGAFIPEATVAWDAEPSGCVPATRAELETGAGEQVVGAGTHRAFVTAPGWSTEIVSITVAAKANETVRVQLKPTKVRVEARRIVILDRVFFETNKAVIKPESFELLNQVANTIVSFPHIGRVSVEGHTDTDGSDAKNLVLSKDRAAAVRAYLIERGVPAERLISEGFGETRPIASNKSASGKAQNRRVEFNLPDQAPEE